MIPHEVIGIIGLAVTGYIGERSLSKAGQQDLATGLSIVTTVAGGIIVIKYVLGSFKEALVWAVGYH